MASTPMRLVVLLVVAAVWPALSGPAVSGVTDVTGETAPEAPPQEEAADGATVRDAPSMAASSEEGAGEEEAAAAAAAPIATEEARLDLEASASLRGSSGWGTGIFGETCCMCSQSLGWTTVLYAAFDYYHFFGGHAPNWWCQQNCEDKCLAKGGHMFGCYDEQRLQEMDSLYGDRSDYKILHEDHYGNMC